MQFDRKKLSNGQLINLYKQILLPRLIEEKMLILLRQNKISKWFSGIGQEAISVGSAAALQKDEYILPMHRNLGVFTTREIPLSRLFSQFQGKMKGFTKGRDRSFHFGTNEFHIVGMISHLGPQLGVADGIALANKLSGENKTTLVFSGDGGSSEGDFHEALNVAAVWDLPVIFMIENNGYGLSTPSNEQFKFKNFVDKGPGYGMEAIKIDGNNVLDVYHAVETAAKKIRKNPMPILIEAMTFRMRGHEEASGTKYVPQELFDKWAKKDPVDNYEQFLLKEKIISQEEIDDLRAEIKADINKGLKLASEDVYPEVNTEQQLADLFLPTEAKPIAPKSEKKSSKRYVDAISDGLKQSFEKYPELVIMGQDVADYGGVFKITEGFIDKFGKDRIRNTPLCESAIIGIGLGMSIKKQKSVIEMQFADFVTCGFNQIVNNLAKSHYRWGQNADVVVRMPTGAGVAAGPFHSQSNEAWFFHTPGLKIVFPSNPYEAKGLLAAAIEDPNPVMYFEHKALYRSLTDEIPDDYYTVEIGKANIINEGTDITIITYGMAVHWAKEAMNDLTDLSVELIDLRTLLPWDTETVEKSVLKTGKVLICNEDCLTGSISGEIAAWISENCFEALDAPVMREGSLDTPVPFNADLEQNFLPKERIKSKLKKLAEY
ncbi:dehydrogenase E1 component subunit alpha/beta [Marivirga sp.]|uniref:alpha-ketoacid dehydrogenase subunit alpha/beta n=1 Tax=Marivirga sp. TaxID=2018662 RepID=UPI0025F603AE|nr:dehydrogenase E1 component subunit alpha/beta [Marivirga sp.]